MYAQSPDPGPGPSYGGNGYYAQPYGRPVSQPPYGAQYNSQYGPPMGNPYGPNVVYGPPRQQGGSSGNMALPLIGGLAGGLLLGDLLGGF